MGRNFSTTIEDKMYFMNISFNSKLVEFYLATNLALHTTINRLLILNLEYDLVEKYESN